MIKEYVPKDYNGCLIVYSIFYQQSNHNLKQSRNTLNKLY